jgi:hypothetical protein
VKLSATNPGELWKSPRISMRSAVKPVSSSSSLTAVSSTSHSRPRRRPGPREAPGSAPPTGTRYCSTRMILPSCSAMMTTALVPPVRDTYSHRPRFRAVNILALPHRLDRRVMVVGHSSISLSGISLGLPPVLGKCSASTTSRLSPTAATDSVGRAAGFHLDQKRGHRLAPAFRGGDLVIALSAMISARCSIAER